MNNLRSALLAFGLLGLFTLMMGCAGQPAVQPTTAQPTTAQPAVQPTTAQPTTVQPTTAQPTKASLTAVEEAMAAVKGLSVADREKKLLEGAKKEGALQLYSSMNVDDIQPLADNFMKKYPGIKTTAFRANSDDLYLKISTEGRAKQSAWDVTDIETDFVYTLDQEGNFAPWDSPVRSEIPETLRDPRGIWTSLYLNANVLTWNTKLVKPEDAPKKYEDLLDPKWKGKLSLEASGYLWAYYILKTMGQDKGMAYLQQLAAQKPQLIKGRTNQTNLLIAGEISASVVLYDNQEIRQKKKGAPVDFVYVEPVLIENRPLMLNKNAQHPYAALLYFDWVMSKEGQSFMVGQTNRISVRPDVPPLDEIQASVLKGKYIILPPDEVGKNLKSTHDMFDKTFGLTGK